MACSLASTDDGSLRVTRIRGLLVSKRLAETAVIAPHGRFDQTGPIIIAAADDRQEDMAGVIAAGIERRRERARA